MAKLKKIFLGSVTVKELNIKFNGSITINAKKGIVTFKNTDQVFNFIIPGDGTWTSPWLYGANKLIIELTLNGKKHTVELTFNDNIDKKAVFEYFRNILPNKKGVNSTKTKKYNSLQTLQKTKTKKQNLILSTGVNVHKKKLLTIEELKHVSENGKLPINLIFELDGTILDKTPTKYKFTGSLIKKTMNKFLTEIIKTEIIKDWLPNNSTIYSKKPSQQNRIYYYLEANANNMPVELEIYYSDGKNIIGDSMSSGVYYIA